MYCATVYVECEKNPCKLLRKFRFISCLNIEAQFVSNERVIHYASTRVFLEILLLT